MKNLFIALVATVIGMSASAQDSTVVVKDSSAPAKADTVRIGGMVIIKKNKGESVTVITDSTRKKSNVSTNWLIVDLGFSNVSNQKNFEFRPGKSVNVNLWFVMQKVNLIKHVVNLKYGLGLELNNYHFDDERVRLTNTAPYYTIDPSLTAVKKNKLAADYLTVPMMLNFNFTPNNKKKQSFGFSAGMSAGYLYSSRQKIKTNDDKDKTKEDFGLEPFKLSYIGELSLGKLRFYGSYATKSMWENTLDKTPFTVGIRFSKW